MKGGVGLRAVLCYNFGNLKGNYDRSSRSKTK